MTSTRWIRLYGYFVLVAAAYGVVVAHLPVVLGNTWSVCAIDDGSSLPCVLTIHLYDGGLTVLLILFGWYSVTRASASRVGHYRTLLTLALMIEIAFFTFEAEELLWNFQNGAAAWENYIIASIALVLLGGFLFGAYVLIRVSKAAAGRVRGGSAIPISSDGFYHPADEDEIIRLIQHARAHALQVRSRGAAHSVAWSVYTDAGTDDPSLPNKVSVEEPPEGPHINLMLDRLNGLEWVDETQGIVEAEAGIHLGTDPRDPTGSASLEKSLLFQVFLKGWGLNDLGGITHQTVSGFLGTGSAGGSLTYDLGENILAFRIVDGRGVARWVEKGEQAFDAVAVSMGLLGVVTKIRLQLTPTFNIEGQQRTTPVSGPECPIDLFGSGRNSQPSLRTFLEDVPYTRLLWWPQAKAERVVIWEARRTAPSRWPDPTLNPYREFEPNLGGQLEQLGGAIFFTLLGNRGIFRTFRKLGTIFRRFGSNVRARLRESVGAVLGWVAATVLTVLLGAISLPIVLVFAIFQGLLRRLFPAVLGLFQPMSAKKGPVRFADYYWRSLPMDNSADDVLLGTGFTELWVPLKYTERTMQLLRAHFEGGGFGATGFYATELYAGQKTASWLSPGHASGEYAEGTLRIDLFWYAFNEGMPNGSDGFFRQFWDLFRANGIPFRLHWGKYIPDFDHAEWAAYYRSQLPRWDDFMELRQRWDPDDVFLTRYWRLRLLGES